MVRSGWLGLDGSYTVVVTCVCTHRNNAYLTGIDVSWGYLNCMRNPHRIWVPSTIL